MSNFKKKIVATVTAIVTTSSFCGGCGLGFEEIESLPSESFVDESHSMDSEPILGEVNGFSDSDKKIYYSIQVGHHLLSNMIKGNFSLSQLFKYNLGKDFGLSKGDRYDCVLNLTIDKYAEAISYYNNGEVEKFKNCYRELVMNPKFLNKSDLIEVLSAKLNKYSSGSVNDSDNYQLERDSIIIDGVCLKKLLPLTYDSSKMDDVMDFFAVQYCYDNKECSFDRYAEAMLFGIPFFISQEANKVISTRICIDFNNDQVYVYDKKEIGNLINKLKNKLNSEYDVSCWEYNDANGMYFVFNKDGVGSILRNGSLCERYISNIDYADDTLLSNLTTDFCDFDYYQFESFYEDCVGSDKTYQKN